MYLSPLLLSVEQLLGIKVRKFLVIGSYFFAIDGVFMNFSMVSLVELNGLVEVRGFQWEEIY